MGSSTRRPTVAAFLSALVMASLVVVATGAPASADATCKGRKATITDNSARDRDGRTGIIRGTPYNDVIVGSARPELIIGGGGGDIICGRGGGDAILGYGGRDRIFGGRGGDLIVGGRGDDVLRGNNGADDIRGRQGDDTIDGGRHRDICFQGAGTGQVQRCENADLAVLVIPPVDATEGDITVTVRVDNLGPAGSAYDLRLDDIQYQEDDMRCEWPTEAQWVRQSWLKAGGSRKHDVAMSCNVFDDSGSMRFKANVRPLRFDHDPSNNVSKAIVTVAGIP